jgi:hypothetical protein
VRCMCGFASRKLPWELRTVFFKNSEVVLTHQDSSEI